jgi:hypothetical protein
MRDLSCPGDKLLELQMRFLLKGQSANLLATFLASIIFVKLEARGSPRIHQLTRMLLERDDVGNETQTVCAVVLVDRNAPN